MKGGKVNIKGPKWGPLMPSVPPDSPNFPQEMNQGGGHLFLSRANAPPPHLNPASDLQSPRRRGNISLPQNGARGNHHHDMHWGTPSPPGVSPRGNHSHPQHRPGFRTPPNIQVHNGPPMPPGHLNGMAMWHPSVPIQMQSGFPLNDMEQQKRGLRPTMMAMSSPEPPPCPQSWVGGTMGPIGNGHIGALPPGDDRIAHVDKVATGAHNEMLSGKKGVTTARVAQATLSALGVHAFEAIGILPQDVPCLRQLTTLESRVNAFIHSYVAGRKIATLHDLSLDLAREEGVKDFEDLGLGPLLCHELVVHYFAPPVGVKIHKITAGEVVKHLANCIGHQPKEKLQVESFLSYVSNQRSLPSPEHLCVRIQSLGTHIGLIRRAKKAEVEQMGTWVRQVTEVAKSGKQGVMARVDLFLAAQREKEASRGKRKRFSSSPDSDDDTGDEEKDFDNPKQSGTSKRKLKLEDARANVIPGTAASSCPYPSQAEERARVKKLELQRFVANSENEDFYLSSIELQEFVACLKDACQNRSVHEVLMKMIEMSRKFKGTKKRSGKSKIFKAYPAIGLLNVAVLSVKAGFWDSMYQNFIDAANDTDVAHREKFRTVQTSGPVHVGLSKQKIPAKARESPGPEEIVAAVSEHYEMYLKPRIVDACHNQQKGWWAFLRWVHECEDWITGKYSVRAFDSLGFGKFSHFLEQYVESLPSWVISVLGEKDRGRKLVAKVPKERCCAFLAQAIPAVHQDGASVEDHVLGLLYRQFKVGSIEELGVSSFDDLLEARKDWASTLATVDHVFFLEPLVASGATKGISASVGQARENNRQAGVLSDVAPEARVGVLGCMTSNDAAKCLSNAPLLVDLAQWSQWHSVFAPTLGSLLDWFEREGSKWGLQAILTCEGALLRIDGKATAESFLLAAVKGRGDKMAVALMSLIALYGGTSNAPVALLKSHASKGLDILLESSAGEWALKSPSSPVAVSSKRKFADSKVGQIVKPKATSGVGACGNVVLHAGGSFEGNMAGRAGDQSSVLCKCVMECLSCVIPEFRVFTAEILLPALSPLIAGTPALLVNMCLTSEQKSILHGLGFCLGIPEWISDYNTCALCPTQSSQSTVSCPEDMEIEKSDQVQLETKVSDEIVNCNGCALMENGATGDSKKGSTDVSTVAYSSPSTVHNSPQNRGSDGANGIGQTQRKRDRTGRKLEASKDAALPVRVASIEAEASTVVEDIRKHEFGVGQDIQGEGCDLLARQHARMGRALHRLSSDLYSQDSHFVLELVQNADDNAYKPGVEAALFFLIQEGRIVVLNNETGFTAANIRALCDVGNSTKAGMNTGYIGHKGIGFKSVFRVTDAPEIHSNGFHVKFDISEGDLGFILPTCIPPPPTGDSSADLLVLMSEIETPGSMSQCWNTRINLPIKASLQKGTGLNLLASKFSDLHPSLLLFLHRLRCIAVRNELTGSMVRMRREDKGENLVEVVHGAGTATWMVVRQQLKAAVQRPGITETEIALAFQLNEVSTGTYEAYSEQQQVFAFLPLRSYGLRFILQGDFKVPSSREEVDCDSDWNQWLRSEVPNVFLKATEAFQKTLAGCSTPGKAVSSFMSFVPMEGEVLGFFAPLPRMILSSLRGSACLPVEGGGWAMPCVLLRGWSDSTRQLLPDVFLNEHLGLRYLDKDVSIADVLALKLGVQQFGAGTLVALMKSICQRKGALIALGIEWVQAWLLALHDCFVADLKSHHPGIFYEDKCSSFRLELQSLPYIPLSNGTFTSLADGPVWFAGELRENGLGVNSVLSKFKLLSSELRTIHPGLVSLKHDGCPTEESSRDLQGFSSLLNVEQLKNNPIEKVVSVLQRLGVSKLSAHELLKSHVLPTMAKDDCLVKAPRLVVEYMGFIISHLDSHCATCISGEENVIAELQKCAVIVTSKGLIRASQQPVHFSPAMGNNFDMRLILEGTNLSWIEVSSLYLELRAKGCELSRLRAFFKELGVTDFVKVVHVERKVLDKGASGWKNCVWEGGEASEKGWIVQDWHSPELAELLTSMSPGADSATMEEQNCRVRLIKRCAGILAALDCNWDDYYYQFCKASYSPFAGNVAVLQNATVSSFLLLLQQCAWVQSRLDGKLHVPTELFRSCEAVERILGSHAPYAVTPIKSTGFIDALGLRTEVSVDDALQLLRYWSQLKSFLEASIQEMARFYAFLWENFSSHKEDVLRVFRSGESIFVPLHWNKNERAAQKGMFYSGESLCWSDPTNKLDLLSFDQKRRLRVPVSPLCGIYPGLHDFFVKGCFVQETPGFDAYLEVLKTMAAAEPPSTALTYVMDVFNLWSSEISRGIVEPSEILRRKQRFEEAESRIFATSEGKWVSLSDQKGLVCICDDKKLGEEFKEFSGSIHFILMTDDDLREELKRSGVQKKDKWTVRPLVEALGIPKLSEVVQREVIKYGRRDSRKIEALVDWILPYAQRYLKHHHADRYRYIQGIGIAEALRRLRFGAVDQLYFQYSLRSNLIRSNKKTPCTCILEDNTLYVVEDFVHDYCNIYAELSRLFFGGKPDLPIANVLHLITLMTSSGSSKDEVEGFMQNVQGIQPVMDTEEPWTLGTRPTYGHHAPHLAGWPPQTWNPPVFQTSAEKSFGLNHHCSVVAMPQSSQNHLVPMNVHNVAAYPNFREDTFWDGQPARIMEEGIAGRGPLIGDVQDVPYLQRPLGPVSNEGTRKIHSSGPSQRQEAPCPTPSQGLDGAFSRTEDPSQPMDVEEVMIDGSDSMPVENAPQNRAMTNFQGRDCLGAQPSNEQQRETGRSGEALVYQYLSSHHGEKHVKWLNKEGESGAAYDIVVMKDRGKKEFVEVKATRSAGKDWFEISPYEWDFAKSHPDSFTIIRVCLGAPSQQVKLLRLPNPVKLAQDRVLQLALLLPAVQENAPKNPQILSSF